MIQLYFSDSYRFLFSIPEAVSPHRGSMKLQPSSFLLQKADTGFLVFFFLFWWPVYQKQEIKRAAT